MRKILEFGEAREDFFLFDRAHAFEAEGFDVVAGENTAHDHGGLQSFEVHVMIAAAGEVSGEPAGKRVPRAGGIMDVLQRIGGATEEVAILTEEQTPVLPFFDGDDARAEGLDFFAGFDEAGFLGQFARLAVIEDEHVHALEQIEERRLGDVDPEVHRVGDDELGFGHLVEHLELQFRRDVGEEQVVGVAVMGRKLRGESFKNIERDGAGLAGVHVPHVFARPAEGFAGCALHAIEIDAAALQKIPMLGGKVFADDADEIDRGKIAGGDGGVGGRSTEEIKTLFDGSFHVVETHGTNNKNGHEAKTRRRMVGSQGQIRASARA